MLYLKKKSSLFSGDLQIFEWEISSKGCIRRKLVWTKVREIKARLYSMC